MTTVRASLVFPAQAGIQTRDADARMRRAAHAVGMGGGGLGMRLRKGPLRGEG